MEIFVPDALLDDAAEGDWEGLRINLFQVDYDPSETGRVVRQWQTVWSDEDALLGSGSFYRE